MKKIISYFIIVTACTSAHASWSSHRAQWRATRAQQPAELAAAQEALEKQLIDASHDAQLNYNLGVLYYKQKNYEAAHNCFERAAQTKEPALREQAHFNSGNAQVALEKFADAIAAYDQVLALNPQHERALHNRALAQEMLQQQQEKEKEEERKKEEHDKKEQEKQKDKQPQDKNNEQQKQKSENDTGKEEQKPSQEKHEQKEGSEQHNNQHEQGAEAKEQKTQSAHEQAAANQEQQQGQEAESAQAEQAKVAERELEQKLDKKELTALNAAQQQSNEQYKQMIQAQVKQHMPRNVGQKNW